MSGLIAGMIIGFRLALYAWTRAEKRAVESGFVEIFGAVYVLKKAVVTEESK